MKKCNFDALDKNFVYVYFEEHRRNGNYLYKIFSNGVSRHARFIKEKENLSTPIVNHIGFLFFDNKWRIAELDYFQGGRITRELEEAEFNNLHLFYILKITKLHIKKFYEIFSDKLLKGSWFFSFCRYNFKNGLKLLDQSNSLFLRHKIPMFIIIFLQLFCSKKFKYNCIDVVFEYFEQFEIKIFDKKKTPYELFNEIRLKYENNDFVL